MPEQAHGIVDANESELHDEPHLEGSRITVLQIYERVEGTSDRTHLKQSGESSRAILSNNADFARLHGEYEHAGIVLYDDQNMSVTGQNG
ncbi:MAG: DUF5615 family PIN-like protein [Halobacteriales archaeon]